MKISAAALLKARESAEFHESQLRSFLVSFIRVNGSGAQTEFADRIDVGRAFICELVSGRKGFGSETARKIVGLR